MPDPQSNPVSSLLDRFIPPAVLALAAYVGLWALARGGVIPLPPETAGWTGLGVGALLGLLLDRLPGGGTKNAPGTDDDD
ncbi:hypothetical protein [Thiohalorhabdus methylotrophus]|uniref:XapX domain-containing protein n=1 Tax=Thiohalorhabdus methylotrophus TaxID=3242694 RepID=A0ABV4TST8_9GAMM